MMTLTLRAMTEADITPIVDWMLTIPLWQRYGLQHGQSTANFREGIARGDVLHVADEDGTACGFAWCLLDGMFGFAPYLKLLGVHPQKSGRNIGGQLLMKVESVAQEHKRRDVFLLVSDFNTGAQRFYQKHGYEQIGAIPFLVLPDVTELIFWKKL
jgi:ribosomal protein S18 acetylase RimI-like enzyme